MRRAIVVVSPIRRSITPGLKLVSARPLTSDWQGLMLILSMCRNAGRPCQCNHSHLVGRTEPRVGNQL